MKRLLEFLNPTRATQLGFLLFLVASPAYYICRSNHFSMAGHLQHSGDLTSLAVLTDGLWTIGFLTSSVLAFRSEISFRYVFVFALGVAFLFFGDPRGVGAILQIPVHIALCVFSIACLIGWIT